MTNCNFYDRNNVNNFVLLFVLLYYIIIVLFVLYCLFLTPYVSVAS